jgi:hypothetical protein
MIDKREGSPVSQIPDLGFSKDQACQLIQDAFDSDSKLRIRFGNLVQGNLSINYTNSSDYRNGETMDLCIHKIPIGNEIMITQQYPVDRWKKERPLGLFFKEISISTGNTVLPRNWHEVDSREWNSRNLINRVKGGELRVNGVLHDAERYEMIFLLYQKYFSGDSNDLGIPIESLDISEVNIENIQDHIRALQMVDIMINNPENAKFFNYGTKGVFGYDSDSYIACGIDVEQIME